MTTMNLVTGWLGRLASDRLADVRDAGAREGMAAMQSELIASAQREGALRDENERLKASLLDEKAWPDQSKTLVGEEYTALRKEHEALLADNRFARAALKRVTAVLDKVVDVPLCGSCCRSSVPAGELREALQVDFTRQDRFEAEAVTALLVEITDAAREGRLNCSSVHILANKVREAERKS